MSPCDHNLIKTLLSTVLILVQNFNWSCHQLGLHVDVHPMVLLSTGTHSAWPCMVGTKLGEKLKAGGEAGVGKRDVGLTPDSLCCHPSCHPARVLPHLPPAGGCQLHSLTSLKPINQFLRTPFAFHATGHALPGGLAGVCCLGEHLHPKVSAPVAYWCYIRLGVFRSCSKC